MTILLDTDVLVAWINKREGKHHQAMQLVDRILEGAWGPPSTTDYVLDEALTLLLARGAAPEAADRLLGFTVGSGAGGGRPGFPLVRVTDSAFGGAIPLFRRYFRRGLSFTDCTSLAFMAERRLDAIASFDRGFDGLAARVES